MINLYSKATNFVISKIVSLQTFFMSRPRIDIDLILNPTNKFGQKAIEFSSIQDYEVIPAGKQRFELEFYWNYKLKLVNNSMKPAYNVKIESISKGTNDYLSSIDSVNSIKASEFIEIDYTIRHRSSMNADESKVFLKSFPGHIDKIEILISYYNEARTKFYTRFEMTKNLKLNKHLLRKRKINKCCPTTGDKTQRWQ
jgi:hypothetical protein